MYTDNGFVLQQDNDADEKTTLIDGPHCNPHSMCRGRGVLNHCQRGSSMMACDSPCQLSSDKPYDSSNDLSSWSEPLAIKPPPEFQDSSPYSSTPQDSPLTSPQVTLGRSVRPHATAIAPARLTPARLHPGVPKWLEKMAVKMVTQVSNKSFLRHYQASVNL